MIQPPNDVTPMHPLNDIQYNTNSPTQHERRLAVFGATTDKLMETLDGQWAKSLLKASSVFKSKWLSAIPSNPSPRLTDFEVMAAINHRGLRPD